MEKQNCVNKRALHNYDSSGKSCKKERKMQMRLKVLSLLVSHLQGKDGEIMLEIQYLEMGLCISVQNTHGSYEFYRAFFHLSGQR
jgi:hypothetical protein